MDCDKAPRVLTLDIFMPYTNALYIFGVVLGAIALLMLIPILTALSSGEGRQVAAFGVSFGVTGFFAGTLILGSRGSAQKLNLREAVLVILLVWFLLPVFGALPYLLGDTLELPTDAYFEAVSGLTTTGATLVESVEGLPRSILIWRSLLQWLGGYASILMAVAVLSAVGFGGLPVFRPVVAAADTGSLLHRLAPVARALFATYAVLTLACFVCLGLSIPLFEAVCLALSTISTGGYVTTDGTLSVFGNGASFIVTIFMIVGALNFALHAEVGKAQLSQYRNEPEVVYFFGIGFLVLVMLIAILWREGPPPNGFSAFFYTVSFMTTSGYAIGDGKMLDSVPPVLLLAIALLGGSALSTAGGFKIVRALLLFRHSLAELTRLAHPHSVARVYYGVSAVAEIQFKGIWVYFVSFVIVLALTSLFVSLYDFDYLTSFSAAAAALANMGPLLAFTTARTASYVDMPAAVKIVLSMAMIMGRVEILILLPIFNRSYWQS